jgi:glycosyltransferase involved in cell wall biosynthesis
MACGVPVAAYPVPGPFDIVGADGRGVHGGLRRIGALDEDLGNAIRRALTADRTAAAAEARNYAWDHCTDLFEEGLASDITLGKIDRAAA